MDRIPLILSELQLKKQNDDSTYSSNVYFLFVFLPHTWHVALCFATLDPFATLIPPVVLVSQDHIHVHVIVDRWIQTTDVEAQEWKHPPEKKNRKGKSFS